MNLPVVLTHEAEVEFDGAADWYEQHAGLGREFTSSVREVPRRIADMPESHAVIYKNVRRTRVSRFPYNIFYRSNPDRVEVVADFHAHRDPSGWQKRID